MFRRSWLSSRMPESLLDLVYDMKSQAKYAHLGRLAASVINHWPTHERFIRTSLSGYDDAELGQIDEIARKILLLAGDEIAGFVESYRWMCQEMNREALHFKKHGSYRLSSFSEAERLVYSNAPYMKKYMEGLLISQIIWRNHSASFLYFTNDFLPRLGDGFRYLEIGPGHGLFLSTAAESAACVRAEAWDVSAESIRQTAHALSILGAPSMVKLLQRDVLVPGDGGDGAGFDGIAISEVLEHIEYPREALASLRGALAPGGHIFINVPLNSPAADHIYLLRDAGEVRALVESAGLEIVDLELAAVTGLTVAEAERQKATISCLIIAR